MRLASLLAATAALGVLAIAGPASAQVIFGNAYGTGAYIDANANVYIAANSNDPMDPGVSNSNAGDNSIYTLSLSPFSTTASATATDTDGPFAASGTAFGSSTALFDSAAVGQVEFTGSQSATSNSDNGSAVAYGGGSFEYYFQTTTAATFSVSYNLSSSTIGCCYTEVTVGDINTGFDVLDQSIYGPKNTGLLTINLTAGDSYALVIYDGNSHDSGATVSGVGTSSVPYDDRYSFSIASVSAAPEPSTWALMIAGVGMAGGMLRRARKGLSGRFGAAVVA